MLNKIDKGVYRVCAAVGSLSYVGIIAMMVLNLIDVFLTKFFGINVQGAYELTERLLMCTVFASLAYGEVCDAHIHTTLFIARLPRVLKFLAFGVTSLLSTGASAFWTYAIWLQIFESIRTNTITAVLKIPLYPFYAFAFVCMIFMTIALAWHMIRVFLAIRNDECAEEVTKSWA